MESTTFNEEADYWLCKKGDEFTPGYFRAINPGLKKIRGLYGNYKISRFTPGFLFEFRLLMKRQGLSTSTQNRYVDLISRVISFSYKQRRINANPCLGYEKAREVNKEMQFWCEDEVNEFLVFADWKYPRGSIRRWIYCAYLIALETGMRGGEIWGLKASDIPNEGNTLRVSRQFLGGTSFDLTKGKDSRLVPFSDGLKAEVQQVLTEEGVVSSERTLFVTKNGDPVDHISFYKSVFKKDVKQSGLRQIRFHDLRHTALTLMVKRGILLPVVQKIAGHKSVRTTMRYVHVVGKDIDEIGSQFGLSRCKKPAKLRLLRPVAE